jgi:hypothetical protein
MPTGAFSDPWPPLENEAERLALEAMSVERIAELAGWPKDFLGRYKHQNLLNGLVMSFRWHWKGRGTEAPDQSVKTINEAWESYLEAVRKYPDWKPGWRKMFSHVSRLDLE